MVKDAWSKVWNYEVKEDDSIVGVPLGKLAVVVVLTGALTAGAYFSFSLAVNHYDDSSNKPISQDEPQALMTSSVRKQNLG